MQTIHLFHFLVTFLLGIRYDVIFFPLTFGDITSYTGTYYSVAEPVHF